MIKIYFPNSNGKIEFTKDELEQELNQTYKEGYDAGYADRKYSYYYSNAIGSSGYDYSLHNNVTISTTSAADNAVTITAADLNNEDCK